MARRAGLSRDRVVDEAVAMVEEAGAAALSLSDLARRLEIRTPSLYKHVDGLDDVRAAVAARAVTLLAEALEQAALGRSGDDAVRRMARAYRTLGREHPRLFEALPLATQDQAPAVQAAGARAMRVLVAVFEGRGQHGDDAVHAIRGFRAAVHGFVLLESQGGFRLGADPEVSFERLVDALVAGLPGA